MATQPTDTRTVTGWVGWLWFGGLMLATVGLFQVFQALVALFDDGFAVQVEEQIVVFDLNAWGWTHLIIGTLLVIAAVGVLNGSLWGRILGVVIASLNILFQVMIMPAYPIWALAVIVLDVLVIYALVVHGREASAI